MESLNDDCLFQIVNLLQLKDQISLFVALPAVQGVLQSLWCRKYRKLQLKYEDVPDELFFFLKVWNADGYEKVSFSNPFYDHLALGKEQFQIFLGVINGSVKDMRVEHLCDNSFNTLKKYKYPNVSKLGVSITSVTDEHVLEMKQIFPNLAELVLNIDGLSRGLKFFEQIFEKLQQLTSIRIEGFSRSTNVKWDNQKAFENFCNLERIHVQNFNFLWLQEIEKFFKLREISIRESQSQPAMNSFFSKLYNHKGKELIQLETSFHDWKQAPGNWKLQNLKKFSLFGGSIEDFIENFERFPSVREIIFERCYDQNESVLDDLLNQIGNSCEYINIENCLFSFGDITLDVGKFDGKRTNLLKINFFGNQSSLSYETINLAIKGSSSLVTVTTKETVVQFNKPRLRAMFEPQ